MPSSTSRLGLLEPLGSDAVAEIRTAVTNNATTVDGLPTWTAPTFGAGYAAAGSGYQGAQYGYDTRGFVVMRGMATKGTSLPAVADVVATLPANFRPAAIEVFGVPMLNSAPAATAMLVLQVDTAGVITIVAIFGTLSAGASNYYVPLATVRFSQVN